MYKRLALAVIALAVKDARAGRKKALRWLFHEDSELYYCLAGIHPDEIWRVLRDSGMDEAIDTYAILNKSGPEKRMNAPQDLTQTTGISGGKAAHIIPEPAYR